MSNFTMPFPGDESYRMIGSESEYTSPYNDIYDDDGLAAKNPHAALTDTINPKLIAHSKDTAKSNVWLTNGGRLYFDHGSVLEYASPECRTPDQLAIYEKAGETIVAETVKKAGENFAGDSSWKAYKRSGYSTIRSADGRILLGQMSAGHHENYATFLDIRLNQSCASLESYLASRAIWAGAGIVHGEGYSIHQKAFGVDNTPLGIMRSRIENLVVHGEKVPFRLHDTDHRLEIRLGDGNMSPWAIRTKYGMTSFVLRLIENGEFPREAMLPATRGPLLRMISQRPYLSFDTENSEKVTAAQHQRMIARACLDFAERYPYARVSADEIQAAQDIENVTHDIEAYLERNDPDKLPAIADRIDWAAKRHHIHTRGITDADISSENLDAVKLDLQWEELGDHTASARWYRKVGNTVDTASVKRAISLPPNTRARDRIEVLRKIALNEEEKIVFVNWSRIVTKTDSGSRKGYSF